MDRTPTQASWIWAAVAAATGVLAVVAVIGAWNHERMADRQVGEGELFASDGAAAHNRFTELDRIYAPDSVVRHLRNELEIEAVSLVDSHGEIVASSSDGLVGTAVDNSHLLRGLDNSLMSALARTLTTPLMIDGVAEWGPGDVVYEVLQPIAGGALLLDYDMTELLARRVRPEGVTQGTLLLLAAAAASFLISLVSAVGRSRVMRRNETIFHEARLLHEHSQALQATNQDLTQARQEAVDALALAEEKNRIRSEFVLMINHELRTPLTSVVTGAELLAGSDSLAEEERAAVVNAIMTDGRRLEALIAQMLEAARIENRGLTLTFASHDGADVCQAAVNAHPRLESDPASDSLATVWTHPSTLIQLIGSLADNAISHGARTVTLRCSDALDLDVAVTTGVRPATPVFFQVIDDGPGIDPDFLPRIFEKFEKHGFGSGTGLGLYLAAMIAEALGASLEVATSSEGTTVVVAVPRSIAKTLDLAS